MSTNDSWEKLSHNEDVKRLLELARSDNPLIALGVERREISWTQFMAWLFDPHRRPRSALVFAESLLSIAIQTICETPEHLTENVHPPAREHLETIRNLRDTRVTEIKSVQAEVSLGDAGRVDVLLKCSIGGKRLTLLIENKIDSQESDAQLDEYVNHYLQELKEDEIILPMLIQLGDAPEDKSSCKWAIVWNREDVSKWLRNGCERCREKGVAFPSLIESYSQLFKAWNTAEQVKKKEWKLIKQIQRSGEQRAEWKLLEKWLTVSEELFFKEVFEGVLEGFSEDKNLIDVLKRFGLNRPDYAQILGRDEIMQFDKDSWYIDCPIEGQVKGVNVHYEVRSRTVLRIDVELNPYIGSIEKSDLKEKLALPLQLKARIMQGIRQAILKDSERVKLLEGVDAHTRYLRHHDAPQACGAVNFESDKGEDDITPQRCAKFIAGVIESVTKPIDEAIEKVCTTGDG